MQAFRPEQAGDQSGQRFAVRRVGRDGQERGVDRFPPLRTRLRGHRVSERVLGSPVRQRSRSWRLVPPRLVQTCGVDAKRIENRRGDELVDPGKLFFSELRGRRLVLLLCSFALGGQQGLVLPLECGGPPARVLLRGHGREQLDALVATPGRRLRVSAAPEPLRHRSHPACVDPRLRTAQIGEARDQDVEHPFLGLGQLDRPLEPQHRAGPGTHVGEGVDHLVRRPLVHGHVVPRVRAGRWRKPVLRRFETESLDERNRVGRHIRPPELVETGTDQGPNNTPRTGWPLDNALVDVSPPWRGVIATRRELERKPKHGQAA